MTEEKRKQLVQWFRADMTDEKKEQLAEWFISLDQEKQIKIALECIEELIFTHDINFCEDSKVLSWNETGDELGYD